MDKKKLRTIETYNNSAEAMKKKFANIGVRVEDVKRAFSFCDTPNPNVLEIGCGAGREATEILHYTYKYLGLDISKSFIEMAQKEVPNAEFEVADIDEYSFHNNLDVIFSFASLLHSNRENVKTILQKGHDALNSGGIIYISLKYGEYQEVYKKDEFGERVYFMYTPDVIKELAGAGFEPVYEDLQELAGQKWFTICLKKI